MSMSLYYQSYETDIVNRENFFSNHSSLTWQQKLKEKLGDEISSTILVLNLERIRTFVKKLSLLLKSFSEVVVFY